MKISNPDQTFILRFLPVGNADAIHLRFLDEHDIWHNILIDGGSRQTYQKVFRPLLEEIYEAKEVIDLWVLTHWDNDHIEGAALFFCNDVFPKKDFIKKVWFNANYRLHKAASGFIGKNEGVMLRDYLEIQLGIPSPIITVETPATIISGLKIIPLGPETEIYRNAMTDMQVFSPVGRKECDYHKPLEALKDSLIYQDRSLANRSSIVLLLEFCDFKVLLLADASPIDLVPRLHRLGYSSESPLKVDLVKTAHHGSKKNTSKELLDLLQCKHFIFTADGSDPGKFPDKETIARILQHKPERTHLLHLYFNHHNPVLESIFAVDGADVMELLNFKVHFPLPDISTYLLES